MKEVTIRDKVFQESISPERISGRIRELSREISEVWPGTKPLLLSVLNGAFIFTADLIRSLDFDPEVAFVKVSSYGGGMSSTGEVKSLMGLNTDVKGRKVLIVEDIVDTGHTLDWLRRDLREKGAEEVRMVTLLFKPEAFHYDHSPEFIGFRIPNDFVVGYGLDYDQLGRSLPGIYKLKQG